MIMQYGNVCNVLLRLTQGTTKHSSSIVLCVAEEQINCMSTAVRFITQYAI